ncbi:MAG: GNAT family N-acetyltransferase [Planctomycetota bacterium]
MVTTNSAIVGKPLAADHAGRLTTRELMSPVAFAELAPVWTDLAARAAAPSLFLTLEWFETWWHCHGRGRQLLIIVVEQAARVIGIAPLMLTRRIAGCLPFAKIEFLSMMRYANSPLNCAGSLDIIAAERYDEVVARVLEHLLERRDWDCLRLHPVNLAGRLPEQLELLAREQRLRHHRAHVFANSCIAWPGDFTAYAAMRPAGLQKKRRQAEARLRARGAIAYRDHRSFAELPGGFAAIEAIERRSWKWRRGLTISSRWYRGFYRRLAEVAGERGWLHLRTLELEHTPIAYDYNVAFAGRVVSLKASFDAAYASYSPGTLLQWDVIKQFLEAGVHHIDLLWGNATYKRRWATQVEPHVEIFLFNRTRAASVLHALLFWLRLHRPMRYLINGLHRLAWRLGAG